MSAKQERVADAELSVLKVLWEGGPLTAREIAEPLYGRPTASSIGTVQKLLQRLEAKQLVKRRRAAPAHTFTAAVSQGEFVGRQLEQMADKLTDGSLAPLLMHLMRTRGLEKCEIDELRRFLDEERS